MPGVGDGVVNMIMIPDPWKHQVEGMEFARDKRGVMLAMDMGTGKTRTTIDLIRERGHKFTLVVCPLSVVQVWPKQFAMFAPGVKVLALDQGTVAQKQTRMAEFFRDCYRTGGAGVVVINYESVWRSPMAEYLMRIPLECLVLDECHRIKSHDGKASVFLGRLAQRIPWRIGLTGTPIPHSPLDLYGQFRALAPHVFGLNYFAFKARYAVLGGYENKQVVGYKNEEEMNRKFYDHSFRVTKEVLDLPEALHDSRLCRLSTKALKVYQALENDLRAEVEKGEITAGNALVKLLRLQQITGGSVGVDGGGVEKVDESKAMALEDILSDLGALEPVVVFCRFHHDLDVVRDLCAKIDRPFYELSGRMNRLHEWSNPDIPNYGQVLAVQIQSGGVGVDLTRARYCVYYSLGFSLAEYLQSLARVHRPGQTKTVYYLHLIAEGTVDELVYQRLQERADVVEGILDYFKRKENGNGTGQGKAISGPGISGKRNRGAAKGGQAAQVGAGEGNPG